MALDGWFLSPLPTSLFSLLASLCSLLRQPSQQEGSLLAWPSKESELASEWAPTGEPNKTPLSHSPRLLTKIDLSRGISSSMHLVQHPGDDETARSDFTKLIFSGEAESGLGFANSGRDDCWRAGGELATFFLHLTKEREQKIIRNNFNNK